MTRPIRHVKDLPVEGKRVFLRVDFNVPLSKPEAGGRRQVTDDSRIQASLQTIRHLLERGARLLIA
jgi:phosphoglycerate kinase